ncbi:MAG TPA: hypothetical protein VFB82_08925 [Blastocatellia bacterium]|nr:hypothetical protein [Blastocatellia bacterium]
MRVEILDQAEDDLIEGFHFYEAQRPGLGSSFLVSLYEDIDSLRVMVEFIARITRTITGSW